MADITDKKELRSLLEKYKSEMKKQMGSYEEEAPTRITSREYQQFKTEFMSARYTYYEKLCNLSEKILKIKPDPKKAEKTQEAINICHLNITPSGVISFALLAPIFSIVTGALTFFLIFESFFFVFFFLVISLALIMPLNKVPIYMADNWRLKASNQMVLCIFYVVTYMRHTSNLEKAVEFSSQHLAPPLSLDLRKVLWDVETQKYESVKESLESYLKTWKKYNMEFIESFHLIESSLYEGSDERRLLTLDKSLNVMLEETYEKMLHYAHNLKSPMTMLHMLGIILPILGLVILPLVVSFMAEIKWFHIATIYNLVLPLIVYFMGTSILSKRPTGYGSNDISEENPEFKKYRNILIRFGKSEIKINPIWLCIIIGVLLFSVGISPIVLHAIGIDEIPMGREDESSSCGYTYCMLDYQLDEDGNLRGPFGIGASVLSVLVTLSIGISIGLYYSLRSKNVIQIRNRSKKLEQEFASALFQLGNRLGDGMPAEMAVGRVSETMEGTTSGNFFRLVSQNIRRLGMSVPQAIFDPKHGALVYFPSNLIESSMKVFTESVKKGPQIAASALMNVSRYIKEIHKVNERLRDLMSDIVSSMTSQIKFLTPVIAGIVIGITSMISSIIGRLGTQMKNIQADGVGGGALSTFNFGVGIPTFYFQIIVGIYVVQIIYVLTILVNGIQNGSDKLSERYNIGKNLIRSTILYSIISLVIMVLFNMVASSILQFQL